jgi:hypothetical protein
MKRKRDSDTLTPLLSWLSKNGSKHSNLEFRASEKLGGGMGVFTNKEIKPGGLIASISQDCVLTATKALRSPFGQLCSQAIQDDPTGSDEFVLLLWMAMLT